MARKRRLDAAETSHGVRAMDPRELDALVAQAEAELRGGGAGVTCGPRVGGQPVALVEPASAEGSGGCDASDAADDRQLEVKIELGRARLRIEDALRLREGSVVTLEALAGDPVDIVVDGRVVARGEVVVMDGKFSVRVAEIAARGE